jgi:TolB protein
MRCAGIACLLSVLSLTAASDDFPLKHTPLFTYVVDYEAAWSPDGRQIVLISSRHGGLKVHIMDAASESHGSDMKQITSGPDEDDSPAWSPNGRTIVFVSIRNSTSHIFVMNADGSDVRQLTRGPGDNIHPMWSPDGTRILFNTTHFSHANLSGEENAAGNRVIGEGRDDSMNLASVRPDGTNLQRITRAGGFTYASYSAEGRFIVHRKQQGETSQIFVMNADGSNDHNLSGSSTVDGWPAWSPDGKRIVFSRHTEKGFQLFVMNRDGSAVRQLTDATGEFVNPRWSPDGSKILCGRRLGSISLVILPAP